MTAFTVTCDRCCESFEDHHRGEWYDWRKAMFTYPMVLCEDCTKDLKAMLDMWWAAKRDNREQHSERSA